jgi:cytoskeletal protein CcmA (bactofilin family)
VSKTTAIKTVLGPKSSFKGELALDSDATIDGRFEGDLRVAGMLDLLKASRVTGTIIAGNLGVAGQVDADVIAEQGIELKAGAKLIGRLFSTRISVSEGGEYEGEINIGPEALKAAVAWIEQIKKEQDQADRSQVRTPLNTVKPAVKPVADEAEAVASTERVARTEPQPIAIDPNVIGSILSQRRAKVMATAGV